MKSNVTTAQASPLSTVIIGNKQNKHLNHLTQLAWIAAYTLLWNGKKFNRQTRRTVRSLLQDYLLNAANPADAVCELVQRSLMARRKMQSDYGRMRTRPENWFAPDHPHGFARTADWYKRLTRERRHDPVLAHWLKAFADAVIQYGTQPTPRVFHYWRSCFQQTNSQQLLNLFLAFVANFHREENK